ncbi:DNA mismatch repair protein MutL [Cucumispora dikerogammari]|nr:DNA mismatch repair protein MutL [Cucumispora dikerogammari]
MTASPTPKRLTKDLFKNAIIIGQFDKKFIILKLKQNTNTLFVAVDQHALHERILLERNSPSPCRLAVKFNDLLKIPFMEYMVRQIPLLNNPWVCAHGRPCFTII